VPLQLIALWKNDPETFEELRDLLSEDRGVGLIDEIKVGPVQFGREDTSGPPEFYFVSFRPSRCTDIFPFGDLSYGTRRVLKIILSFLSEGSSVRLIEHPEDGIHTGLVKKVVSQLRTYSEARNTQVILTSHSSTVLNMLNPEEVRLVEMNDGITTVRPLTPRQVERAGKYMAEEGSLSDYVGTVMEG
jgi:hypothetical protein